jgi:acyl CoA:acetate/3-ketoacid CoA transferase beta subunit
VVKQVATNLGLFEVTPQGFVMLEIAPGYTPEEVQEVTEAKLIIPNNLKEFHVE